MAEMVRKVPFFIGSRYAQATSIAKQANISMETFWNSMLEARGNPQKVPQLQADARKLFSELEPKVSNFERIEKRSVGPRAKCQMIIKNITGVVIIATGIIASVASGLRSLHLAFDAIGIGLIFSTMTDSVDLEKIRRIAKNSNAGWKRIWDALVMIKDSPPAGMNSILENVDFGKPPETFAQARFARVSQSRSSWEHVRLIRQTALE